MPGKLSDLLWAPLLARGYDRFNKIAEDAGLRDKRRALLAHARGRTLEIGAGTGVNLELFGRGCHPNRDTLATIEASRSRSRRWSETGCRRRLGSCGRWWWGARGGQPIPDRLLSGQVRDQRPLIEGSRRWRTSERTNSLSRDSGSAPIAGTNSARAAPAIPSANAHAWSIEPHSSIRATTRSIR